MSTVEAYARDWGATAAELLFPRSCVGCGRPPAAGFDYFCWDCLAGMLFLSAPHCSRCGEPVEGRVDHEFVCHLCAHGQRGFDAARSVVRHDGVLRDALHTFKYRRGLWLRDDFVRLLHLGFESHYETSRIDAVTWVPLHPVRRRRRQYDQARVLASGLARRLGRPLAPRLLRRVRFRRSQTGLTAEKRASNVADAFTAVPRKGLENTSVLLVDDVMTTGATVTACCHRLRKAGVGRVQVLTLARG